MSQNAVTAIVHTTIETTVHGGCSGTYPLHELALLERKLQLNGAEMSVLEEWPEHVKRAVPLTYEQLEVEVERLRDRYTFVVGDQQSYDLLAEMLPQPFTRSLLAATNRIYKAFRVIDEDRAPTAEDLRRLSRLFHEVPVDTIDLSEFNAKDLEETPQTHIDMAYVDHLKDAGVSGPLAIQVARLRALGTVTHAEVDKLPRTGPATIARVLEADKTYGAPPLEEVGEDMGDDDTLDSE